MVGEIAKPIEDSRQENTTRIYSEGAENKGSVGYCPCHKRMIIYYQIHKQINARQGANMRHACAADRSSEATCL